MGLQPAEAEATALTSGSSRLFGIWLVRLNRLAVSSARRERDTPQLVRSTRVYLAVIALVAAVFAAAPDMLAFWLPGHYVRPLVDFAEWVYSVQIVSFLLSPCFFFAVLYIYGKRTARYFGATYLVAVVFLFLGSVLGFAVYLSSLPLLGPSSVVLGGQFWPTGAFEMVSSALGQVFVGFAALSLASLRAGGTLVSPGRGSDSSTP